MAGNNSLELEIHSLFQEGLPLETICAEIISKYEKIDVLSPFESESISHFLIAAGKIHLLFKFYLRCLRKNSLAQFPWGYLASAIMQTESQLSDDLIDLIEMGLAAQADEQSALKVHTLLQSIPALQSRLQNQKQLFEIDQMQTKVRLMAQLNHNRLYQLKELEEQTLQQLVKIFPQDIEVKLLHQAHLEKKADEILAKIRLTPRSPSAMKKMLEQAHPDSEEFVENLKKQTRLLARRLKSEQPDQIYNLTMLAMQFELFDLALEIVNEGPATFASEWLKAEILFESGRFLDLLKHIENIETKMTATPESTYGAVYLKAQAYFGLGQKEIAIQLLESLSEKVPSYRSTEALLHEWKTS
ncbi:MAG: hypothetical protein H7061_14180 [Bdellovibrionaceae bacterium]|nr:hypothetical protein [Bdellovibrio sp.]